MDASGLDMDLGLFGGGSRRIGSSCVDRRLIPLLHLGKVNTFCYHDDNQVKMAIYSKERSCNPNQNYAVGESAGFYVFSCPRTLHQL